MTDPRQIAIESLRNIIDNQTFFSETKNNPEIAGHKDYAFINMLVLTSLRHLVFLEKCIKKFATKKLPDKNAFARWALISATCEVLFLDTPDYAVLNSYVNLVKKENDKYVAGFVNAILRKICATKTELLAEDNGEFFPLPFKKLLSQDYSPAEIKQIEAASLAEAPLDLTIKSDSAAWAEKLGGILLPTGAIRLENNGKITKLPGYTSGDWWVQDFAASLAVLALKPQKGMRILDLCAAPGGKTAQMINAGAEVTALDISENRLLTLAENLHRLKLPVAKIICEDAHTYLNNFEQEKFDAILLDAPCSASGTLRRHPELVHLKDLNDIRKLAGVQKSLLELSGKALKDGGELIYCTCSVAKAEGEKQIKTFLETHPEFKLVPLTEKDITLFPTHSLDQLITPEGFIRTLPQYLSDLGGMDAFFIAKLQKVK